MSDFYTYFRENMALLGMPAPTSLFATGKQAKETIAALAGAIKAFGGKATLGEIIGTIPSLSAVGDLFTLGSAISASFYVGACIGSFAIATQRTLSGGKQLVDFFEAGRQTVSDPLLVQRLHYQYIRAGGRMR